MARMGPWLRKLAVHPRMPWFVGLLCVAALSPTLGWGLLQDDWVLAAWSRGLFRGAAGSPPAWDLFRLTEHTPELRSAQLELGTLPWWSHPDARLAFLRPLASLSHSLDHAVSAWPSVMHAESLFVYGALVLSVGVLARRLLDSNGLGPAVATLAFGIDDAHVLAAGWIANRHALLGALATTLMLVAHDRARRDDWRPGAWLGPLALALGLASGEGALAAVAYLFAHAVWLDPGSPRQKLVALLPYAGVVLAWALLYRALGAGTQGLGFYFDPLREPGQFLAALPLRLPVLLGAQLLPSPSELWSYGPRHVEQVAALTLTVLLVAMTGAASSLLRVSPVSRFAATGMVLSLLPSCTTLASDRLLVFAGIGGSLLLGAMVASTDPDAARRTRRWLTSLLVVSNLAFPLLLVPARFVFVDHFLRMPYERAARTLPPAPGRTLVVMCTPDPFWVYVGSAIAAVRTGEPPPARIRILGVVQRGTGTVERIGPRTLRVSIDEGFVHDPGSTLFRDPTHVMATGAEVRLTDVVATVAETREDGRASVVHFDFTELPESPSMLWTTWSGSDGFTTIVPPASGAPVRCGESPP